MFDEPTTYGYSNPLWANYTNQCVRYQSGPPGDPIDQYDYDARYDGWTYLPSLVDIARYAFQRYWTRTYGVPNVIEEEWLWSPQFEDRPRQQPARLPQWIPMDKPILQPDAPVRPIPWPLIPDRKPDPLPDGSDRGYDVPNPTPAPVYPPINYGPPIQTRPDSPVFVHVNPPRRPPEDREKEKKFGGASDATQEFFKRVSKFKEFSTELQDILEAIHKAIDPKVLKKLKAERGKGYRPTPQSLAKDIYDNFDNIDWEKALDEVVQNWAEDKVMGTAIRAGDLASKRLGLKSTLQGRGWMPRW